MLQKNIQNIMEGKRYKLRSTEKNRHILWTHQTVSTTGEKHPGGKSGRQNRKR